MTARTLGQLFDGFDSGIAAQHAALPVTDVCDNSAAVTPGALFVAVPGTHHDGAAFVADAVARGAAAVVSEVAVTAEVPVIRAPDARAALAHLASAWHGFPARTLQLVGITGTIGKTSVLTMLAEILAAAGVRAGSIGSLGVAFEGRSIETGNTTPGILTLQHALAEMRRRGARVAAMEVTSHALLQQRVQGLRFDLGVFTNLRMLEHMEYHDSFDDYASAKLRFFEHLEPAAPLIYSAGDRAVKQAVRVHGGPRISCGGGSAWVGIRRERLSLRGARIRLRVRRPLPRLDGSCLDPCEIRLQLRMIGRANTGNAALAAVAALVLGAPPAAVRSALAASEPPRRRLEVIRDRDPIIIDDTVGHPDSITAVCELVERIRHDRVRAVLAVRGMRGPQVNRATAEALAVWARRLGMEQLHITSAADTADERNTVRDDEREAVLSVLRRERVEFTHHDRLETAVRAALAGAGGCDVVLLLGAQGMDAAAELVRRHSALGQPEVTARARGAG